MMPCVNCIYYERYFGSCKAALKKPALNIESKKDGSWGCKHGKDEAGHPISWPGHERPVTLEPEIGEDGGAK